MHELVRQSVAVAIIMAMMPDNEIFSIMYVHELLIITVIEGNPCLSQNDVLA